MLELPSAEFAGDIPATGSAVDGELPDGRSLVQEIQDSVSLFRNGSTGDFTVATGLCGLGLKRSVLTGERLF